MALYGEWSRRPKTEYRIKDRQRFQESTARIVALCHHDPRDRRWKDVDAIPIGSEDVIMRYTICNRCHPPLAEKGP